MRNAETSQTSLFGLIGHFRDEIKALIREEVQLAKTEMSEKVSRMGRNAVWLAVGGLAAFAGLIIFLASLSSLLSFAFERAGIQRSLAFFIGAFIIGGGAAAFGLGFVAKALKSFSKEPLAPEKTLDTIKHLKTTSAEQPSHPNHLAPQPKRSSNEIEASVKATRREVGETAEAITDRLKPRYMGHVLKRKIQDHPVRSGLISAGTGLLGGFMIRRRLRNSHA